MILNPKFLSRPNEHLLRLRKYLGLLMVGLFCWSGQAAVANNWHQMRQQMVAEHLSGRDITDRGVLAAMSEVERHLYVPQNVRRSAYADRPLPIGEGQTISQPYVVALMSQLLDIEPGMRVLEIGTGSGYQAAVLERMGAEVYSIEIVGALADRTVGLFASLELPIQVRHADGYEGWSESAPFDRIMITAAANHIPPPLLNQLKTGGKLILPLGSTRFYQTLTLVTRLPDGKTSVAYHGNVRFVPMTGKMLE